jgi:hypothetical protein
MADYRGFYQQKLRYLRMVKMAWKKPTLLSAILTINAYNKIKLYIGLRHLFLFSKLNIVSNI